jgi:hypothetical protein
MAVTFFKQRNKVWNLSLNSSNTATSKSSRWQILDKMSKLRNENCNSSRGRLTGCAVTRTLQVSVSHSRIIQTKMWSRLGSNCSHWILSSSQNQCATWTFWRSPWTKQSKSKIKFKQVGKLRLKWGSGWSSYKVSLKIWIKNLSWYKEVKGMAPELTDKWILAQITLAAGIQVVLGETLIQVRLKEICQIRGRTIWGPLNRNLRKDLAQIKFARQRQQLTCLFIWEVKQIHKPEFHQYGKMLVQSEPRQIRESPSQGPPLRPELFQWLVTGSVLIIKALG